MGRERLRRGYSLEVIFEEDSDYCSHFDSLDGVPLTCYTSEHNHNKINSKGQTHPQPTSDLFSLLQVFGLDQTDFNQNTFSNHSIPSSSSQHNSTQDSHNTLDMETCLIEPWNIYPSDSTHNCKSSYNDRNFRELSPSSDSQISPVSNNNGGRQSRVSRRQILESANWFINYDEDEQAVLQGTSSSPNKNQLKPNFILTSNKSHGHVLPKLTLLTNKVDICRLTNKITSSNIRFSDKTDEDIFPSSSPGIGIEDDECSSSRSGSASSSGSDVKRVRAIFEKRGRLTQILPSSSSEDEISNCTNSRFIKRIPPIGNGNSTKSKLERKISENLRMTPEIPSLRSAYSQINLNQMERYDLVDLLVNDNVIIEDSPDLFQLHRLDRNRSESHGLSIGNYGFRSNLSKDSTSPKSTLRRSKSVGAGIQSLQGDLLMTQNEFGSYGEGRSRPCIILNELPARNTVSKVRSVFEQILKTKMTGPTYQNGNGTQNLDQDGKFIPKFTQSLSSIKSNPTSKIIRLDSTNTSLGSSFSKSNNIDRKLKSCQQITKELEKGVPGDEILSSGTAEEEPKLISPDILHRIRSCGTSTTYYGGEILAKTIKNQKCSITKQRNLTEDEVDFSFSPINSNEFTLGLNKCSIAGKHNQETTITKLSMAGIVDHTHFGSFFCTQRRPHPLYDTTPRIISVLPKSPSISPGKSNSPVASFLEGRNSPEGCESNSESSTNTTIKGEDNTSSTTGWINTTNIGTDTFSDISHGITSKTELKGFYSSKVHPNGNLPLLAKSNLSKKFSDTGPDEGVWF